MIPNDFGIIRQADHNLFALLFPALSDISEYEFEVIYPEYIADKYINTSGSLGDLTGYSAAQIDISKYDYILMPASTQTTITHYSGTNINGIGDSTSNNLLGVRNNAGGLSVAWGLFERQSAQNYALINVVSGWECPVIGFIRHRSDQVNPLGIIQPINPGILQPGSLQPGSLQPGSLQPAVEDPDVQEDELDVQDPEEDQEES